MRKILKIVVTVFIVFSMILSITSIAWARVSDVKGHWAEAQINDWVEKGLVKGYSDGTFRPDNPITRAEFCALLNRSFGFIRKANNTFTDVSQKDWFADDISKAIAQGYLTGFPDKTAGPNKNITRQEVVTILARVLKLKINDSAVSKYADASKFAAWGKGSIIAISALGYVNTYTDNTFRPDVNASRDDVVYILSKAVGDLYNTAGKYGPETGTKEIAGNVTISRPDITLKNMVIKGNLYLSEGIGEGSVTLENVTVRGTTTICGGAADSIISIGSSLGTLVNEPEKGKTRLAVKPATTVASTPAAIVVANPPPPSGGDPPSTPPPASNAITISSVATIANIQVAYGTTRGAINLPASVNISLSNGTTESAPVVWNTSTYNPNVAGTYTFPGTIAPPAGVTNPSNLAASVRVVVGQITVTGFEPIADIHVPLGTSIGAIPLPETVTLNLSNTTTRSVRVSWNTSSYNPGAAGTYVITGTFEIPEGITNPGNNNVNANIVVNAPDPITVINVSGISDMFVGFGTTLGAISLPGSVTLNLSDLTTRSAVVIWNTSASAYNPNAGGTYAISGTFELPDDITNSDNTVNINITVVVGFAAESIADKYVVKGTAVADVRLPASVVIHLQNGTTNIAGIVWNTSGLNTNAVGMYTLTGTLAMPAGVENRNNTGVSMNVFVVQPVIDPRPNTPVVTPAGIVINEFDSLGAGISSTEGILELDTQNKVSGTASINVTSNVTTTAESFSLDYTANLILSDMNNLQFSVYTPDLSQINRVAIWLYSATGGYYSRLFNKWRLVDGWNRISIARNEFIANKRYETDNPSFSNINRIRILFYPEDGCKPSVNVDRISYNMQTRPKVLFTFDDGWYDLIDGNITDNAFSYMTSKGFKGTVWAKRSSSALSGNAHDMENGVPAYLNEADLDRMYNAGWDIGNHTVNHLELSSLSDEQIRSEYQQNEDWLVSKNWSRGAHFAAYPSGDYNERLIEILQGMGVLAARTTVYGLQSNPVDNMFKLKCIYLDETLNTPQDPTRAMAQVRMDIDHAIQTGSTVIFMIHKVENSQDSLAMSTSDFKQIVDYIDQRRSSIDVVTMSEWYNAYAGIEQSVVNVTGVNPIPGINVAYGTTIGAINLPAQVRVDLSDNRAATVGVVWDGSSYNPNISGPQTLTGNLVLPAGIQNRNNLRANVRVIVGPQPVVTVTTVSAITDIHVAYGTTREELTLPAMVQVTLSNSTTTAIGVTWGNANPVYNPTVAGTYNFTGTLTTTSGITIPSGLTASVRVIVGPQPVVTVTTVSAITGIHVAYGTTREELPLPMVVQVTLSNSTTTAIGVTWGNASPTYNPTSVGIYAFTGTLTTTSGITNPLGLTASVNVEVEALRIIAVESVPDISVPLHTTDVALSYLPEHVNVSLSYGVTPLQLDVTWSSETYDPNVPGSYQFTGVLTIPEGIEPDTWSISAIVVVEEPIPDP